MGKTMKSIDEIIENLTGEERIIVRRLRSLALECLPSATEKSLYGAPFYTHHRMICFIWPPSLYWGKKKRTLVDKGVTLGFCQGNRMANDEGLLQVEGRKQMYCMYFKSIKEVHDNQIRSLLFEAELIDQYFGRKKKKGRMLG